MLNKQYNKYISAWLGLIAYVLLVIFSPEGFSLFVSKLSGPHTISFATNQRGEQVLVLHHHARAYLSDRLEMYSDEHHHDLGHARPDHVYLLPKFQQKAALLNQNDSFQPCCAGIDTLSAPYTLPFISLLRTTEPQKLPQPPPSIFRIEQLRRTVVLII